MNENPFESRFAVAILRVGSVSDRTAKGEEKKTEKLIAPGMKRRKSFESMHLRARLDCY